MKEMSTLTFPNGETYEVVDKVARAVDWKATKTVTGVEGTVFPESAVKLTSDQTLVNGFNEGMFVEGAKYIVTWNGTDYEVVCGKADGGYCIGNLSLGGLGADTGEPFGIVSYGGSSCFVYKATTTSETVTFKIVGAPEVEYNTIPDEYLPDGKVGKDVIGYIASPQDITLMEQEGMRLGLVNVDTSLISGETYTVSYNGVDYKCKYENNAMGNSGVMMGGEDTGEPFIFINEDGMTAIIDLAGNTVVNFSIKGLVNLPINNEYMPPAVTLDLTNNISITNEQNDNYPIGDYMSVDNLLFLALKSGMIKVRCKITGRVYLADGTVFVDYTDEILELSGNIHRYENLIQICIVWNTNIIFIIKALGTSNATCVIKRINVS